MKIKIRIKIPPVIPISLSGPRAIKELDALLDTGSTYVIISWEDALELGYEPTKAPEVPVATGGGMITAPLIVLESMELLGLKRNKVKALVKDLTETGIDAIIGWSFLDNYSFRINAKRKSLEFDV